MLNRAYEEVIDFIAQTSSPGKLLAFRPSAESKERVYHLINQEKSGSLTPDERSELHHYLQLEHLMRLAKARAEGFQSPSNG
jgi:hypothetical protein